MKSPRIYTYKVTFEEIPHWYWGVHKESKYEDGYMGSPSTHRWMWDFYTPHLQVLELFDDWEEALRVEKRLIESDLNNPFCLNENSGGFLSLESCKRGGKKVVELGIGCFGIGPLERSEIGRKSAQKCMEMRVGIHAPGVASLAGKLGAEVNRINGTGLHDPQVREKALAKQRKRVELIHIATGKILHFDSLREAANALNLNRRNLGAVCHGRQRTTKGFLARFA
jgi:hypothetical protein